MLNLLNQTVRGQIIEETKGEENVKRKKVSFNQNEVYKDRIYQQVKEYLEGFYSKETILNTPIVASVNLSRRIINKEASLYCKEPERVFNNMSPEQEELIRQIYKDIKIDTLMQKLNQNFKLQDQAHVYIVPRAGKLKGCPLMSHQIDVIPSSADPEMGEVYLINGFDRISANVKVSNTGDGVNEMIADEDDYKESMKAIAWWSPKFNLITNESGNVISQDIDNPIGGVVPFVDIHAMKDGEYWVRTGASVTEFTVQYNGALTDLGNIVRMQGFGQAWLKSSPDQKMENVQVGPNKILHLPVDPNNGTPAEFGYSNANADLSGSLAYLEGLLSSFLTSRGVDPKVVNIKGESITYNSGIDRLLSMVEQFEATEQDMEIFKDAENKILKIIIAYVSTYGGSDVLPDYPNLNFSPDAYVDVKFAEPSAIQSESEKLGNIQSRLDMSLISQIEAIAIDRAIEEDEAEKVYEEIKKQQQELMQPEQEESIPEVK